MRMLAGLGFGLALVGATPSLALTVSAAPNRDQAQHLKQERSGSGPSLRDTFVGAGRPQPGVNFTGAAPTYGETVTYGFGGVTTTVRTDDRARYHTPLARDPELRLRRR